MSPFSFGFLPEISLAGASGKPFESTVEVDPISFAMLSNLPEMSLNGCKYYRRFIPKKSCAILSRSFSFPYFKCLDPYLIKPLDDSDIHRLADLQPPGWRDVRPVFRKFMPFPWFYPVKVEVGGSLWGVGEAILHGETAWIGNIIVSPSQRQKGIGSSITRFLRDKMQGLGARSQFLLATEMGKGLYEKCGFVTESRYLFFREMAYSSESRAMPCTRIREIGLKDLHRLQALDREITGEDRKGLLQIFWEGGQCIYAAGSETLLGAYLPELGEGLILARDRIAGMELLHYRFRQGLPLIVVPEQHERVIRWALMNGFEQYRVAYRMVYGQAIAWKPEGVFSRIGGYLG